MALFRQLKLLDPAVEFVTCLTICFRQAPLRFAFDLGNIKTIAAADRSQQIIPVFLRSISLGESREHRYQPDREQLAGLEGVLMAQ